MAKENPGWGYDRIVGAMANLGFRISDQTVANILRRHDIPPAPKPMQATSFLDNLLRYEEGQGLDRFWPCSGRLEVVILYVLLSLLAQGSYWLRIVRGLNQERT
jgi:hypothetical protein